MDQPLKLQTNLKEVLGRFKKLPLAVQQGIGQGLRGALKELEQKVLTGTRVRWRRGPAGLAGRLTSSVKPGGQLGLDAEIGFRKTRGFPYEFAQEYGALAKPGKAMAIPLTPQARRVTSPRQMQNLHLVKPMGGKAFLVESRKRSSVFHFILVKSIPARLGFRNTCLSNVSLIERGVLLGARRGQAQVEAAG